MDTFQKYPPLILLYSELTLKSKAGYYYKHACENEYWHNTLANFFAKIFLD